MPRAPPASSILNYFALGILVFVVVVLFYGIIAIHDITHLIAKQRNHPHQDAIHAAGWVSLFTLHVLWPFLWIWAMAYRPERGWGFRQDSSGRMIAGEVAELRRRVSDLEYLTKLQSKANLDGPIKPRRETLEHARRCERGQRRVPPGVPPSRAEWCIFPMPG